MHDAAMSFLRRQIATLGDTSAWRVLEIGAYDVNGSPCTLLADQVAAYLGLDRRPGPGVDLVADAGAYDGAGAFDLVVCTEVLEHTAPEPVLQCAWRALRPGGRLLLTAAGPERIPHSVDGGPLAPGEYYQAVDDLDLGDLLVAIGFTGMRIWRYTDRGDVYATAEKPTGGTDHVS